MTVPSTWSAEPEEKAAVDDMYEMMNSLAELLHNCADVRYGEPSGGHSVG
ncbi:hypothetical protein [Nocardia wallacei]|nr:hypothetical protein [Nocardia wallacei]